MPVRLEVFAIIMLLVGYTQKLVRSDAAFNSYIQSGNPERIAEIPSP
jgi:hypothetical protein